MYRFENDIYLWAILGILPLILIVFLFIQNWKKRKLRQFGNEEIVKRLMPNVSKTLPIVKFVLFALRSLALQLLFENDALVHHLFRYLF